MNKHLLFFTVLAFTAAKAQQSPPPYQMTPKEAEKHAKEVEKSKEKGNIIWDYDTVFVAGVPNCIIYKVDKGALRPDDFSIRTLTGQELIYVRAGQGPDYTAVHAPNTPVPTCGYYTYMFSDSKKEGETYNGTRPFKTVGRYMLIVNGNAIDPNAEAIFIAENPVRWSVPPPPPPAPTIIVVNNPPPPVQPAPQPQTLYTGNQVQQPAPPPVNTNNTLYTGNQVQQSAPAPVNNNNTLYTGNQVQQPAPAPVNNNNTLYTGNQVQQVNNNTPNYMLVARNTNDDIRVDQNAVYQGGQLIGNIQYTEVNVNGMWTKTMAVTLPNGTQVASGYTQPNGDPHIWTIVTIKDHLQNSITVHEHHDKEDVLWYLVKGFYL